MTEAGEQLILHRSMRSLLTPYLPVLALTLLWYPLVFKIVLPLAGSPALNGTWGLVLLALPMLVLVWWARRLSSERRRILLVRKGDELHTERIDVPLTQLARVLVLGSSRGHGTLGIVFTDGPDTAFDELVTMREVDEAVAVAHEIASWLGVEVERDPPSPTLA